MKAAFWVACVLGAVLGTPIKQVTLLMLENRSFDHMLGYLKRFNSEIDGLNGNETNPWDPADPAKGNVRVSFDAIPYIGIDPQHSVNSTAREIWGSNTFTNPARMDGFVKTNNNSIVMAAYNTSTLPVLQSLARLGAVFDRWFASIPGPTQPNRMYLHAATSVGLAREATEIEFLERFGQRPMFMDLQEANVSWGIYFFDFPLVLELKQLRNYPKNIHSYDDFIAHAANGTLPAYAFLEPRWFNMMEYKESDQHPPHSVTYGDFLLKDVYEALRAGPQWNETLLVATYDEHGGLFDHCPMPQEGVPNPDGMNSTDPPFNFTRLGVRIPTVMVSPWIDADTVVHEVDGKVFDHTSVIGTLRKMYDLRPQPLSLREPYTGTFDGIFNRTTPRTDMPDIIGLAPHLQDSFERWRTLERAPKTDAALAQMALRHPLAAALSPPMNDLQREVVIAARRLTDAQTDLAQIRTEHEGALFVREQINSFLRNSVP